jgi:hypothetical protein
MKPVCLANSVIGHFVCGLDKGRIARWCEESSASDQRSERSNSHYVATSWAWVFLLRGRWWSGLQLSEALALPNRPLCRFIVPLAMQTLGISKVAFG